VEDFSLPVTIRAFDQAPALTAQDLLGQTAQCQAIESLQDLVFNPDEEGFTNTFGPGNIPDEFEVAVEFSIVDPLGFFRYVLRFRYIRNGGANGGSGKLRLKS